MSVDGRPPSRRLAGRYYTRGARRARLPRQRLPAVLGPGCYTHGYLAPVLVNFQCRLRHRPLWGAVYAQSTRVWRYRAPLPYNLAMKRSKPTGKRSDPTFRGRVLSPAELDLIRQQVEGFDSIDVIDDEMRALIESQWPDLASKLPPREPS